jgi:putative addiction module killer protein
MTSTPREIKRYITPDGKVPFADWLDSLKNFKLITVIDKRLLRVSSGNLGNYRSVGEGVCELKINYGPGYRIYFAQVGNSIVVILCGGDKSTQNDDIYKAIEYWKDYRRRENVG